MSRARLGVVGVLAAFVLLVMVGVGASTASAAFTLTALACSGGTTINLCYETTGKTGLFELEGEEEIELLTPVANIKFKSSLGEPIEIECTSVNAEHLNAAKTAFVADGVVTQTEPLVKNYSVTGLFLNFLGCKLVVGNKKCKVPVEQRTVEITGTPLTEEVIDFKPTTGTTFIKIPFENNGAEVCPATLKGEQPVKGEQEAKWLTILTDETEHTLDSVVKSGLKFGASENAAELELEVPVFPLALGDPWAIEETA